MEILPIGENYRKKVDLSMRWEFMINYWKRFTGRKFQPSRWKTAGSEKFFQDKTGKFSQSSGKK
jgi:hypothetical protein